MPTSAIDDMLDNMVKHLEKDMLHHFNVHSRNVRPNEDVIDLVEGEDFYVIERPWWKKTLCIAVYAAMAYAVVHSAFILAKAAFL